MRNESGIGYLTTAGPGAQSCLFCREARWRWLYALREEPLPGRRALPRFVVVCDRCQQDLIRGDRCTLVQRLSEDFGTDANDLFTFFEASITGPVVPQQSG